MGGQTEGLMVMAVIGGGFAIGNIVFTVMSWISRIFFPMIWKYPYPEIPGPEYDNPKYTNNDKGTTVLMAGSFNPPHKGHTEMIEYLSKRYQKVVVVVGHNPDKTYEVTPEQRVQLLESCFKNEEKVSVTSTSDYIWRHVPEAKIFFRGIRSWEKDGADEKKLAILNTWGPLSLGPFWWPRETFFLQGNPAYSHVSSTMIRDFCKEQAAKDSTATSTTTTKRGGKGKVKDPIKEFVPEIIAAKVKDLYSKSKSD
mmetsp:Transcript_20689/g.26707  ORF Transcript_20689/g.26707 Transcript_20689/m.26707 type:complete len:254 (+) Transcript_20689:117-878(+)|eukprot:CAMPEP_0198146920 /NCGR_PEP_ID=MMETSP1443-20131203/32282_1 /TAXON_ID=186043 /ORGANISM="Entomoneis sp., Strain CCMP2396" /LENGTH=253 /DNA_ID=CAMNT_0043811033 /DNA_START=66 /DNA_END=827 /DNA_ORIENTATION=-